MGVGGVVNAADANEALDHGYDLIAVGRAASLIRTGRPHCCR
jgi:dihydroorotate dehydrogenase